MTRPDTMIYWRQTKKVWTQLRVHRRAVTNDALYKLVWLSNQSLDDWHIKITRLSPIWLICCIEVVLRPRKISERCQNPPIRIFSLIFSLIFFFSDLIFFPYSLRINWVREFLYIFRFLSFVSTYTVIICSSVWSNLTQK